MAFEVLETASEALAKDFDVLVTAPEALAKDFDVLVTAPEALATAFDVLVTASEVLATGFDVRATGPDVLATGETSPPSMDRHRGLATPSARTRWIRCHGRIGDQPAKAGPASFPG